MPAPHSPRMARTPRTSATAGFDGVDDTLVTRIAPDLSSTQTMSVKVPPVSMPIRRWAGFPLILTVPYASPVRYRLPAPHICTRIRDVPSASFAVKALIDLQARRGLVLKSNDGLDVIAQQLFYDFSRLIAATKPDDLRRRANERRSIGKIDIKRNEREAVNSRKVPNGAIVGLGQAQEAHLA